MILKNVKFVYVHGINVLGHYKSLLELPLNSVSNFRLQPVFKVNNLVNNRFSYVLEPGYLCTENVFFSCPLEIFYVQILNIIQTEKYSTPYYFRVDISINIFSGDFKKCRTATIEYESKTSIDLKPIYFSHLDLEINLINQFVHNGGDIFELAFDSTRRDLSTLSKELIIHLVNKLQITFFENGKNRPGKDDWFWTEAEIRELPNDLYIIKLITDSLKQKGPVATTDFGLLVTLDSYSAYSPCPHGRPKIIDSSSNEMRLKEHLKLELYKNYDKHEHLLSKITKK